MIGNVRGVGLMIGIEIVDPETGDPDGNGMMRILDLSLEKGVLFYLCGKHQEVIRMIPPLIVTQEQLDEGLRIFEEAVTAFEQEKQVVSIG